MDRSDHGALVASPRAIEGWRHRRRSLPRATGEDTPVRTVSGSGKSSLLCLPLAPPGQPRDRARGIYDFVCGTAREAAFVPPLFSVS